MGQGRERLERPEVAVQAAVGSAPLPREFFARQAAVVARELVGAMLVHRTDEMVLCARIVETEAYVGTADLACHASRGRTARTDVMFGVAGHAYVYLIYGMHDMFNVVTADVGEPQAVLLRAAEPVAPPGAALCGPGKLARGMLITRAQNRADLCTGEALYFTAGRPARRIATSPRVNVAYAGPEWSAALLRFYDEDSAAVSRRPRP